LPSVKGSLLTIATGDLKTNEKRGKAKEAKNS
jgi:hypothetical protein